MDDRINDLRCAAVGIKVVQLPGGRVRGRAARALVVVGEQAAHHRDRTAVLPDRTTPETAVSDVARESRRGDVQGSAVVVDGAADLGALVVRECRVDNEQIPAALDLAGSATARRGFAPVLAESATEHDEPTLHHETPAIPRRIPVHARVTESHDGPRSDVEASTTGRLGPALGDLDFVNQHRAGTDGDSVAHARAVTTLDGEVPHGHVLACCVDDECPEVGGPGVENPCFCQAGPGNREAEALAVESDTRRDCDRTCGDDVACHLDGVPVRCRGERRSQFRECRDLYRRRPDDGHEQGPR